MATNSVGVATSAQPYVIFLPVNPGCVTAACALCLKLWYSR